MGNLLFGKLKQGIMSRIGIKRDYSPDFKSKLKSLIQKKDQPRNEKPVVVLSQDGATNPFAKLLAVKPSKVLAMNEPEPAAVAANPFANLF